jgi:hypothetical protein
MVEGKRLGLAADRKLRSWGWQLMVEGKRLYGS